MRVKGGGEEKKEARKSPPFSFFNEFKNMKAAEKSSLIRKRWEGYNEGRA